MRAPPSRPASVAVLIPALNEEEALPAVLARIPGDVTVVVVDNGSTDATAAVAEAGGAEVVREPARGYGAACLAGLARLHSHAPPPQIVVFLDADGSDDPERIADLCRPILDGRADLVLGVRRGERGEGTILPHARFGNRLVLALVRLLFGRRFRDLPPFRAARLSLLESLAMDDRTWGWTLQMQIRAHVEGARIAEVDTPHRARVRGRSKITGSLPMSLRVGGRMFWTLARERLRASLRRRRRRV